jgi:branched-chain amino acid aminotransferase
VSVLWLNGKLVDTASATVSALDRGLLSGYGLFETLRAYDGKPWAFDDHYDRLRQGSELIALDIPDAASLRAATRETLEANGLVDAGVRLTITGGAGPTDVQADPDSPPNVIVIVWPLRDYTELYENGAALVTLPQGARPLADVKTTSYAVSVAGRVFARRAGGDDALFLGGHKRVLEATGSNLFIASGDALRTPPLEDAILPGVTRRYVMEVAREVGFTISEEHVYVDDMLAADEVVLTSSLREVYPAASVDAQPLKRTGVAERLRDVYETLIRKTLG